MDKIIEMVREVLIWAMEADKTVEMDLGNRKSSTLGNISNSTSETLHVFISSQSPYTIAPDKPFTDSEADEEGIMDLISREDVKKQLDFILKHMAKQYHTIIRCMYRQILDLPVIESRPKGKWLDNPPDSWICSNCGTHYEERLTFKAHNYCCVCGAEMER